MLRDDATFVFTRSVQAKFHYSDFSGGNVSCGKSSICYGLVFYVFADAVGHSSRGEVTDLDHIDVPL